MYRRGSLPLAVGLLIATGIVLMQQGVAGKTGPERWDPVAAALEAGQAAGGDKRGMQSAAMLMVKKNGGVWLHNDVVLRLQVDDNPEPIKELRRLVEKAVRQWNLGNG